MNDASTLKSTIESALSDVHIEDGRRESFDRVVLALEKAVSEYARQAVLAEQGRLLPLLEQCRKIAEWHGNDSDECGTLARHVMEEIAAIRAGTTQQENYER